MNAKKKSISFPEDLLNEALNRAASFKWSLSKYIQELIKADLKTGGPITVKPNSTTESIRLKIPGKRNRPDL